MDNKKRSISDEEWAAIQRWKKDHSYEIVVESTSNQSSPGNALEAASSFSPQLFLGGFLILAGAATGFIQIVMYLRDGYWHSCSLLTTWIYFVGPKDFSQSWLGSPDSWFGLHKVFHGFLDITPLGLTMFFLGHVIMSRDL